MASDTESRDHSRRAAKRTRRRRRRAVLTVLALGGLMLAYRAFQQQAQAH
jgi:hypothetical protein